MRTIRSRLISVRWKIIIWDFCLSMCWMKWRQQKVFCSFGELNWSSNKVSLCTPNRPGIHLSGINDFVGTVQRHLSLKRRLKSNQRVSVSWDIVMWAICHLPTVKNHYADQVVAIQFSISWSHVNSSPSSRAAHSHQPLSTNQARYYTYIELAAKKFEDLPIYGNYIKSPYIYLIHTRKSFCRFLCKLSSDRTRPNEIISTPIVIMPKP